MQSFDFSAGDLFDLAQRLAVKERQALEDAADNGPGFSRDGLAGLLAEGLDARGHIARFEEAWIVRIDQRLEGRRGGRKVRHHVVVQILFLLRPMAAAFLNQPKPGNVFQQAHRVAVTDLIGEVQLATRLVDDRLRRFNAHQRPGARTQKGPVLAGGRQTRNRSACVVRTGGDDLNVLQAGLLRDIGTHRSEDGARGDNSRKQSVRQSEREKQFVRPAFADGIVKLRGAGHRDLKPGCAREQIIEPVGH